jgi:diguanylate cyclase (GGDEF)-like protein
LFFALAAPALAPSLQDLFPFHSGLCGFFMLMSLLATLSTRPATRLSATGLRLTQAALAGLVILFWWYAAMPNRLPAPPQDPARELFVLHFSPLYDGLVVTFLSFGTVILATDHARRELEERNKQLAELTAQLELAARTDPLTGLLNRRAFEAMLADRANTPFAGSVAVVDVNFLKVLNDKHGHKAGDAAIQFVARALRSHFRITDPIFRLGGDEFLVVLEGGQASELMGRLESVDRALRSVRLPGVDGSTHVSVAWGMVDFEGASDLPVAIERADAEMYRRKAERKAAV